MPHIPGRNTDGYADYEYDRRRDDKLTEASAAVRCACCEGHGTVSVGGWLSFRSVECFACSGTGQLFVTKDKADELKYMAGES